MRRRRVLAVLGGAILCPPASIALPKAMPVIGYLGVKAPEPGDSGLEAFLQGLSEIGFRGNRPADHEPVQGQNVVIEYRFAERNYDRVPSLVADLVRREVDVVITTLGAVGVRAVNAATTTIPIVFWMGDDPVERGLVASLARPGGNVTGVTWLDVELMPKRLELMTELVPQARTLGLLVNPNNPNVARVVEDTQKASHAKNVRLHVLRASTDGEVDAAFVTLMRLHADGLIVGTDAFLFLSRDRLVALAAPHAIPAVYEKRECAAVGGLISYGSSLAVGLRHVGMQVGRILKGARPQRPAFASAAGRPDHRVMRRGGTIGRNC